MIRRSKHLVQRKAPRHICVAFSAGDGAAAGVSNAIAQHLRDAAVPAPVVEDGTIALSEALNNVEEHAYGGRNGGPVRVEAFIRHHDLVFCIEDRGVPLPEGPLRGGEMPVGDPVAPESWPEGGFGWAMLHKLTHDLVYCRAKGWNRLQFALSLQTGGQ